MKKSILLPIAMLSCFVGSAQTQNTVRDAGRDGIHMIGNHDEEGEKSPGFSTGDNTYPDNTTLYVLPNNGGTSTFTRAPGNASRYQRTEYLILPSEMAASGFPNGADVNGIGFTISAVGATDQTGTLNIYLKNTTDVTYTLGTSWNVAGFTQVANIPNFTVPVNPTGTYQILFSGGSSFTYSGSGVYVAWEFSNPAGTLGTTAVTHSCNSTQALLYGQRSNTAMPTTLVNSSFRPETQFLNTLYTDVLQVTNIYVQEKCPIPYGIPTIPGARVRNVSGAAENVTLTMEIKDQATSTVRYTDVQTVTGLPAGSAQVVSFAPWTPLVQENEYVTVTSSTGTGEDLLTNNTMTIPMNINGNLFGFCYNLNSAVGFGFTYNGSGGIFATKFHMNGQGSIPSANLFIHNYPVNTGNVIYAVVLNSAGAIVAQTPDYTILATDLGTNKHFSFPVAPVFTDEDYYIGLAQPTGGTVQWYPMGCMVESPYRTNTFYNFAISGGTPVLFGQNYKYMIEAEVISANLLADDVGIESLGMGQVVTVGTMNPQATVKNYGANTESFTVTMTIGPYISTRPVTGLASGLSEVVTFDPWNNSLGTYPVSVCTALPGDLDPSNDCMAETVKVLDLNKTVYGYNAYPAGGSDPVGPTKFSLSNPGTLTSIANQSSSQFVSGGTWAEGKWYGTVYNTVSPYEFIMMDPGSGARTIIGDMGVNMNALSYNTATGVMYGVRYNSSSLASELYTIDLNTGMVVLVGSAPGVYLINLAINNAGQCYSVDMTSDALGSVNLLTGAFTPIGPIGFNAQYAQDMEFDRDENELYMAAYGTTGQLRWVDVTTGNTLLVGNFEGGGEITGFAIPYSIMDYGANQLSFDWPDYTVINSTVGMITVELDPGYEAHYINAYTLNQNGDVYWIGQNYYMPDRSFSAVTPQKLSFTFSLAPLGIIEGMPANNMPIMITSRTHPTVLVPSVVEVELTSLPLLPMTDNTGGGYPITQPWTGTYEPWPVSVDPLLFIPPLPFCVYRGCDVPNIDLDDSSHPSVPGGYAGDDNACGPAGASNSLEWLEAEHPECDNGQTPREVLEDVSGEMGRAAGGGVGPESFVSGKLKYAQKHKLPIHTKFQSWEKPTGDIQPAGSTYAGTNHTGSGGKPDWDWLKGEMAAGEDVEIFFGYFDAAGNFRGGHVVTCTGVIEFPSGLKGITWKDDKKQGVADANGTTQSPSWITVGTDGFMTVPGASTATLTAKITNVVSESYDPAIVFTTDAGTGSSGVPGIVPEGTVIPVVTVVNNGTNTESFDVTMTIGSFSSTKTVSSLISGGSADVMFDPWTNTPGDHTMTVCTQLTGDQNPLNDCFSQDLTVITMKVRQASFDWPNLSVTNSVVGMFTGKFSPGVTGQFINAYTLNQFGDLYWIGQNYYLPDVSFSAVSPQDVSFTFDLSPLGITQGQTISTMPVWITSDATPTTAVPALPPSGYWMDLGVTPMVNNVGGGYPITQPWTGSFESWPVYIDPALFIPPIAKVVYRGCDVPNIDLDDANHPSVPGGYAGDYNACGPAGASNSLEWLEAKHPECANGQTGREVLEDVSGEMGRGAGDGVGPEEFVNGKLKYAQKHKLPIHTKFQSWEKPTGDIQPAGSTYKAENKTGAGGKPDWDWLVHEMEAGEDVELFIGYFDASGNFAGGHVVTCTGVIELGGLKGISYKDDHDQNATNADEVTQTFTWISVATDGFMHVPSESTPTETGKITNIVSESYDPEIVWPSTKTLNLKLFLEGLYAGAGMMFQAQDELGNHFGTGIADQMTVELHRVSDYSVTDFSSGPVDLNIDGTLSVATIPDSLSGPYWITLLHRNSILTVSAYPATFASPVITYDFTTGLSQAFGDNQKDLGDGNFAFWGGDVNQDGIVDSGDMNPVDNLATAVTFGYLPEDCNGDGLVDSGDMNIVDNNATAIIMSWTP